MKYLAMILAVCGLGLMVGCDSNPTNAPTKEAVADANAARAKAIDDNPNLTPQQKQQQKEMMGLTGKGPGSQAGGDREKKN
jgi:hypothetical protein